MAYHMKGRLSFPKTPHYDQAFDYVLNHTNRGIIFTNERNEILYANDMFLKITGYSFAEIKGRTPKFMQSGIQNEAFYEEMKHAIERHGKWQGKLWNRTKNGDIYLQELTIYAFKDEKGTIENFIGFIKRLSGQEAMSFSENLDSELYDSLTNLPNRVLFEKRLQSTLQLVQSNDTLVMLTFFQIKNFHEINARYGLLFGNVLLKRISKRMESKIPQDSMVSRWDGTVFACVTEGHHQKQNIKKMVKQFADILTTPYIINGISIQISVNFGITIADHSSRNEISVMRLLSNAQKALTEAKKHNRLLCFYDEDMDEIDGFVVTEEEISRAIDAKEFELYYQPLIDTNTKELIGFEALVRWNHPIEGLISPGRFIPLAEKTGLINDLGAAVFRDACNQQVKWDEQGYDELIISVNLSMNQFKDDFLVHFISETIDATGADPKRISIELTESSFSEDTENTVFKLKQLNHLGLTIAIDDFGTGYSSLGYLIDFPISVIKIDSSFIEVLESNEKIEAIVKAINTMAKTLGIKVVAEGIETEVQYKLVKQLKCNVVQGYLFGRPEAVKDIETKWLKVNK